MSRYSPILSSPAPRRKRRRGLKIFLIVLAVLVVAAGVAFALNYNTVLLFAGKGTVSVPAASSVEKALRANGNYDVQTSSDSAGGTVVTARSKDGAVTIHSTTGSSGGQKIEAQVDVKKIKGVTTSKSLANLQAVQTKVNGYLAGVIEPSQLAGVESYVAREALAQYQSGQKAFSVSNDFGGTQVRVTGDFETGVVQVDAQGSVSSK